MTLVGITPAPAPAADNPPSATSGRFFFTSQGKTAIVNADGSGLRYFDFDVPGQATWQPSSAFSDGRRVVFLSMEPRRDGPGRPFDEYYTQTPTHLWIHDLTDGSLTEICNRDRLAPFETPALLVNDDRLLVQVVRNRVGQIFSMKLDGSDPREFTRAGEGLPYGLSLSPDGRRVAFHLASPQGYQVWTSDIDGTNRVRVAADPDHLYFGTSWSPDGQWILYVDCQYKNQPGHDWADVCVGRADGSEHRVLTSGEADVVCRDLWRSANARQRFESAGLDARWPDPVSAPHRRARSFPGSIASAKPDVDHFNRDYKPELAHGGTEICRLDPRDGSTKALTHSDPTVWDFRASESPDGKQIVFCRAATGAAPAIWVMDADGQNPRRITQGVDDRGADHPRWLPQAAK